MSLTRVRHDPGTVPLAKGEKRLRQRLQNRVAVITGGASGIGRATAMRFLEDGARVVIADYNRETSEAALAKAAEVHGGDKVRFIRTDVAKEEDVEAMVRCAMESFGRLDIVFNNAGIGGAVGPLVDTRVEDWDSTFSVLARGVFLGTKHGARAMRANGVGGAIINTASIAALSGDGGPVAYSAAKAAVVSLTSSAAVELAPDRIRVNAICPGYIATPLNEGKQARTTREAFSTAQPWPDFGRAEHVAAVVAFLASDDAEFVTGEAMIVDGGLTASGPAMSKNFSRLAGRQGRYVGVTHGNTGEPHKLRKA